MLSKQKKSRGENSSRKGGTEDKPLADSANAQPICWVTGDDAGYDYCSSCAKAAAENARRRGNRDVIPEAGWDGTRQSDGAAYCHGCGKLLGYALNECGFFAELNYWKDVKWDEPVIPEQAYEIVALLDAAEDHGDAEDVDACIRRLKQQPAHHALAPSPTLPQVDMSLSANFRERLP